MCACEPRHEVAERVGERLEESHRNADGQRHPEGVAEAPGVFDARDAGDAADRDRDRASRVDEGVEEGLGGPGIGRRVGGVLVRCVLRLKPGRDVLRVEGAEKTQQVGDALDPLDAAFGVESLHLALELGDDVRVEQLAHLDFAEQFAEECGIDRQCGGSTFGEGRVALVHERTDISEEQVACER